MRIAQSSVEMQSDHHAVLHQQSTASITDTTIDKNWQEIQHRHVLISEQAKQAAAVTLAHADKDSTGDPKLDLFKAILEHILGHKIKLIAAHSEDKPAPSAQDSGTDISTGDDFSASFTANKQESESTDFSAHGSIVTTDGKQVSFTAQVSMSRNQSSSVLINIDSGDNTPPPNPGGTEVKDPLVINFGANSAQLSDKRFSFDLLGNGQANQINLLKNGSGFLALDKNDNGKVDSGKELFGVQSGDGFADLANYDQDHNSWIDENDPVFTQLKIWTKDDAGHDNLISLADAGIGAIYLGHATTSFDLKDSQLNLAGRVRSTGVYLNENGSAGSIQQVDLSI